MSKSSYKTKLQNILRHYVIVIQKRVDKYILIINIYIYIYIFLLTILCITLIINLSLYTINEMGV